MNDIFFSEPSIVCALGSDNHKIWEALVSGSQAGLKKVKALNQKEFWVGQIEKGLLPGSVSSGYDMHVIHVEEACLKGLEKQINLALKKYSLEKIGVCIGSCDNGSELSLKGHREYFKNGSFNKDYSLEMQSADYVATYISKKYDLKGPALAFSTACSSSAGAIIKAAELIRAGICDAVIAGGVDISSDTVLMGFDSLEAVSSEKTNPFSKNRHGITLGEGAALFVLSKEPLDFSCGAVRVKLAGFGESADAYHMTSPDPSGDGAFRAMKAALENAGIEPAQVDYLNLHGTGTKFNDSMEAKAVDRLFGNHKVYCSTTKPLTGHTLGASGAIEAAFCWLSIVYNSGDAPKKLPVQVWDGQQDEELPVLNLVEEKLCGVGAVNVCLSNSFAFGGANSSLVLMRD